MINCCGVAPLWGVTTGCTVLSAVPSFWVLSWKKLHWDSCAFPQEITTGCAVMCEDNTSNEPFSRFKCAIIGYKKELTITEYSLTTNFKVDYKIQKVRILCLVLRLHGETEHDTNDIVTIKGIASAWWNRARHQWQRDHQDPEHFTHSAHEHQHVNASVIPCAHSPVVRFLLSYLPF